VSRAKDIVLQCGLDVVPWNRFASLCNILSMALDAGLNSGSSIETWPTKVSSAIGAIKASRAVQLVSLRKLLQRLDAMNSKSSYKEHARLEAHDILAVFEKNADAECRYPHDMIFGLLSLTRTLRCCQNLVPVDYDMPISELCYKVLEHHIVQHRGFENPELLLLRSKVLHQCLKTLPRVFSTSPAFSTTLASSFLRLRCTPQTYIRFVSDYSKWYSHASLVGSFYDSEHKGWSHLKVNMETDLVCSIPRAYSRSGEAWDTPSPNYDSSSEQAADEHILPQCQVQQIKAALAQNLRMDMQSEHASKLPSPYIEADDEKQIYGYLALLLYIAREKKRFPMSMPYKVAIDDEGVPYSVPLDTQPGDIVCQIETEEGVNALGVLRETTDGNVFVAGRAIHFFTGLPSKGPRGSEIPELMGTISFAVQLYRWKLWRRQMVATFVVDACAAQLLTRPSFF